VTAGGWRLVAASCLLAAGCQSFGGIRPRHSPLPESVRRMSPQPAAEVISLLEAAVRASGLEVARSAPREGYLETRWFDLDRRASVAPPFSGFDRVVKLRFYADPEQGRTRLLAECTVRIVWDPSLPERELERMVPEGHAGRALLDSIVAAVPATGPEPLRP